MTTKKTNPTEILLIKQEKVEQALNGYYLRKGLGATEIMALIQQEKKASLYSDMIAQWEALTAMRLEGSSAIIPVRGTITPDDPFAAYFGETSLNMVLQNYKKALDNKSVKQIVFDIYSPGGYVYGVEAAANAVYENRGQKRTVAFTGSLAASAAYWFASAADEIVLASETSEVGSIGVYLAHFDYSEMLGKMGIKVTEITSGEFKGLGSPYAPLSEGDKKELQKDVDYIMHRFVSTVARNRGMKEEEVMKSATGTTFYGSDAVKRGLADSIKSLQEVLAMTTNAGTAATPTAAATTEQTTTPQVDTEKEAMRVELETLKKKEAESEKGKVMAACSTLYKATFGREATVEEQAGYYEMSEAGRKTLEATLTASAKQRDELVRAKGLTSEQATTGAETKPGDGGLLLEAANQLGYLKQQAAE